MFTVSAFPDKRERQKRKRLVFRLKPVLDPRARIPASSRSHPLLVFPAQKIRPAPFPFAAGVRAAILTPPLVEKL